MIQFQPKDQQLSPVVNSLLALAERCAREAANLHKLQHPRSQEFMERETGRKGWRAYMSEETAAAVEAIEASGIGYFVHEDEDA